MNPFNSCSRSRYLRTFLVSTSEKALEPLNVLSQGRQLAPAPGNKNREKGLRLTPLSGRHAQTPQNYKAALKGLPSSFFN